jgi:uncharacterized protein (DUF1015 family)
VAGVKAFRGVRYNPEVVSDLSLVTTPPYDVISPEQKRAYQERHPKNVIRLTLGESMPGDDEKNNWYKRAADYLNGWLEEGALLRDEEESFYLLRRDYVGRWGDVHVRHGFSALVRIEDPEKRVILGHELTFDDVIVDRLRLIEATRANLCPIFALYSDPKGEVISAIKSSVREPLATMSLEDGSLNTLWRSADPEMFRFVGEKMEDKVIFIADGHHRYATSRLYRNEMRRDDGKNTGSEPYDYVLMTLVALEDEGLAIYPPHRLISGVRDFDGAAFLDGLEEYFDVAPVVHHGPLSEQVDNLVRLMDANAGKNHCFGVLLKDAAPRLLTLKHEMDAHPWFTSVRASVRNELDVPILHRLIIEGMLGVSATCDRHVRYKPDEQEVAELVQKGEVQVGLLINPPTREDVQRVSLAGELMPHKSTYFYPKLLTGLVMNKMY